LRNGRPASGDFRSLYGVYAHHGAARFRRESVGGLMTLKVKLFHLHHTNLQNRTAISLRWDGDNYKLVFNGPGFETGKAVRIRIITKRRMASISSDFLLWLSVYIGEDALSPYQEKDTRFNHERGIFQINPVYLQTFLQAAKRFDGRKWPKWRKELARNALIYYSAALRSGIPFMPLTMGFFGLSLECLGNVRYGKRDKHHMLGARYFKGYLTVRLARHKRHPTTKNQVRAFETNFDKDIDLINQVRNAFYGHSLLHLPEHRKQLLESLRAWGLRNRLSERHVKMSFTEDRLRDVMSSQAHALFKVGLRTNRIFLFLALGIHKNIPFGEYDFRIIGDPKMPVIGEYKGLRFKITSGR
jgi:hypothetical protein